MNRTDRPRVNLSQTEVRLITKISGWKGTVKTDITKMQHRESFETSDTKIKGIKTRRNGQISRHIPKLNQEGISKPSQIGIKQWEWFGNI